MLGWSRCSCCLLVEVNGTTRWLWDRSCRSAPGRPRDEGDEEGAEGFNVASCYQQSGSDGNAAPRVPVPEVRFDHPFHEEMPDGRGFGLRKFLKEVGPEWLALQGPAATGVRAVCSVSAVPLYSLPAHARSRGRGMPVSASTARARPTGRLARRPPRWRLRGRGALRLHAAPERIHQVDDVLR